MLPKICTLLFESTRTNKTNNGYLDSAHTDPSYGVYDAENNNFFKKEMDKIDVSLCFTVMFIAAHDIIDHMIPYPVLPIYLEYSMLLK